MVGEVGVWDLFGELDCTNIMKKAKMKRKMKKRRNTSALKNEMIRWYANQLVDEQKCTEKVGAEEKGEVEACGYYSTYCSIS